MIKTVLVTGANGLLGAQCISALVKNLNCRVLAVWHKGSSRLQTSPPFNLSYMQCDLSDSEAVRALFKKERVNAILHTAVLLPDTSASYDSKAVLANVAATVNLAAAGRDAGCDRFVYCSIVSVYGTTAEANLTFSEDMHPMPEDAYAWTKLAGEQYLQLCCEENAMRGVCLRLSGLHGPDRRTGIIYNVVRAARIGELIRISSANVPFQFLLMDDAVELALRALYQPLEGMGAYLTLNAASAIAPSLQDIAVCAVNMSGKNSCVIVDGPKLARHQIMTTKKLAVWLSFHPKSVRETLHSVFQWLDNVEGGLR